MCNDVFARAWRKSNTALEMGDEDGAKLWRLSGMNDVREYTALSLCGVINHIGARGDTRHDSLRETECV